jgi:hypothetical protein
MSRDNTIAITQLIINHLTDKTLTEANLTITPVTGEPDTFDVNYDVGIRADDGRKGFVVLQTLDDLRSAYADVVMLRLGGDVATRARRRHHDRRGRRNHRQQHTTEGNPRDRHYGNEPARWKIMVCKRMFPRNPRRKDHHRKVPARPASRPDRGSRDRSTNAHRAATPHAR